MERLIDMDEYIAREALRDALYDADAITMNGVKILNQFPAADVAPVRHGRWVKLGKHDWACSVCKMGVPYSYTGHNYCPNCGAKMNLEE